MTIPASVSACLFLKVSSLIFALTFLERMLARAENLSAHVDRLYERNRCKEPGE